MGGSESSGQQTQSPGTLSPVTATLQSLFGGNPVVSAQGQFVPTSFGQGGVFSPAMFSSLTGLLQGQPLTGTEQSILGAQGGGFGGGIQALGLQNALTAQGLLNQGAAILPQLLNADPTAAIAQARQQFGQETIPAILERAPGFSSSDLQRELARGGTELETNIAALREAGMSQRLNTALSGIPAFAQAVGTNLLDQASQVLGFGQLGRELVRDTSPAGDAFRVLTALQSLTGPALTQTSQAHQTAKSGGFFSG